MEQKQFEEIIKRLKDQPISSCLGSLENNVLRRIRLSRQNTESTLWDWVAELFPKPAFAVAALTLAVTVSSGITAVATNSYAATTKSQHLASSALGFDVFNHNDILNLDHH